jgi:hypothetical protein
MSCYVNRSQSTSVAQVSDERLAELIVEYTASARDPMDAEIVCALRELQQRRQAEQSR